MGRVLTNKTQLNYAIESSTPGSLPGSPAWKQLEPNNIKKYGADIKTTAREPISNIRQRRKGSVTDLDSMVEFDADLTMDQFIDFCEGFCYAAFKGFATYVPTAVTSTGYTVASGGAIANGLLVYARGFNTAANNGLKLLAGTSTGTEVKTTGLVAEASPPSNVSLEVVGVRGSSGDLTIDSSGNLNSTTLDFTTLNLTVGQSIWIGGDATVNSFATAANRGYARIRAITATKLTLDKKSQAFSTDAGTGKLIDIYFGRFARNVSGDHADYLERTYQFELTYPNLGSGPADMYEYAKGNYANEIGFELPLANKAVCSFGFVGLDTPVPTTTRATNASSAKETLKNTAFNTSADIARLRIQETDETGLTTDFKSLKINLNNNVSGEKVIGTLGPKYVNVGIFDVNIEADLLFTNYLVVDALRANRTIGLDFAIRNADGAIHIDIPSMTLTTGNRDFPVNQSVTLKSAAQAFRDDVLDTSIGVSVFGYVPAS